MTQYACCDKHGLSRRDLLKGVAAGAVTAASPLAAQVTAPAVEDLLSGAV